MSKTITSVTIDDWRDGCENEHQHVNPSWEEIVSYINRLNGDKHTLVTLTTENQDCHMVIGGGPEDFIAYVTFDNIAFHNLSLTTSSSKTVCLVVGGQDGDYPDNTVIQRDHLLRAAKAFYLQQTLDDTQCWTQT